MMRPDLKFHSVHGKSIRLEWDGRRAVRTDSAAKGIVFSDRPISIDDPVRVRLADISHSDGPLLRFGVTSVDPASLESTEHLEKLGPFKLRKTNGYWLNGLNSAGYDVGSVAHFCLSSSGEVHVTLNPQPKHLFIGGISTARPLWAFFDLSGSVMSIELENEFEAGISSYMWAVRKDVSARIGLGRPPSFPFGGLADSVALAKKVPGKFGGASVGRSGGETAPRPSPPLIPLKQGAGASSASQPASGVHPPSLAAKPNQKTSSSMNPVPSASSGAPKTPGVMRIEKLMETMALLEARGIPPCPIIATSSQRVPCSKCTVGAVNSVFDSCGHTSMCYECAVKTKGSVGRCPTCHMPIKDVIKTYDD